MSDSQSASLDDVKLWDLPSVEEDTVTDGSQTNAFNKPLGKWKFEAPEQEEAIAPLTAGEIEQIRKSAFEEGITSGHQQGYEEGHAEGIEAGKLEGIEQGKESGFAEGKAQADTDAKVHLEALAKLFEQLQAPLIKVDKQVKEELVLLALSLAKAVIKTEVSQSTVSLEQVISECLAVLPIHENAYHIYLHSEDLAALQQTYSPDELSQKCWQLHTSAELSRGGCKVVTQNNAVDMSVARRCEQVFEQLLLEQGLVDDPRAS